MFCPLYKNPAVKQGFNEIITALGGKPMTNEEFRDSALRNQRTGRDWSAMEAAYDIYDQSGGLFLDKVPNSISDEFPDGKDSILFQSLLDYFKGDRNKAIVAKANLFSDAFKEWFGDWIANPTEASKGVDQNGEPKVYYHYTNNENLQWFDNEFDNYFSRVKGGTNHAIFFTTNSDVILNRSTQIPVYLNMRTPYEYTGTKESMRQQETDYTTLVNQAESQGSAIFTNLDDNGLQDQEVDIVFDNTNVKSIKNNGNFGKFNPNIYDKVVSTNKISDDITNRFDNENTLPSTFQRLQSGESVTSDEVISDLFSSKSISGFNDPIARILQKHHVTIVANNTIGNATIAKYVKGKNGAVVLVNMSLASQVSAKYFAQSILHELIHAVTSAAINEGTSRFAKLNNKLYTVMAEAIANGSILIDENSDIYALTDPHEFAAEFMTDRETRDLIYQTARILDSKSNPVMRLFRAFVNSLSRVFVNRSVLGNVADVEKYQKLFYQHIQNQPTIQKQSKLTTKELLEKYNNINFETVLNEQIVDSFNQFSKDDDALEVHNKIRIRFGKKKTNVEYSFDGIVENLKTRLQAIRTSQMTSAEKATQINATQSQIDAFCVANITKYQAINSLLSQVIPYLHESNAELRRKISNGEQISDSRYMTDMHTTYGLYSNIFTTIQNILNDDANIQQLLTEYNKGIEKESEKLTVDDIVQLRNACINAKTTATDGISLLTGILSKNAYNVLSGVAEEVESPSTQEFADAFLNNGVVLDDISQRELHIGAADSSSNDIIRAISHILNNALQDANRDTIPVITRLLQLKKAVDDAGQNVLDIYEYDDKGKTTGYVVRDRKFGKFWRNYDNQLIKINKAISSIFKDIQLADDNRQAPLSDVQKEIKITASQAKQLGLGDSTITIKTSAKDLWNKARNKWLTDNGERKYVDEYYEIQSKLPAMARSALNQYDAQIKLILQLPGVIDENGNKHFDKLTDDQWKQYLKAQEGKKFLYSYTDPFGNKKDGVALEITESLRQYRKDMARLRAKYSGKKITSEAQELDYNPVYDMEHWQQSFDAVVEECGGQEQYNLWFQNKENKFDRNKFMKWARRNCRLQFKKDSEGNALIFQDIENDMKGMDIYYGKRYEELKKTYNETIRNYRDMYGDINPEDMSEAMQNFLEHLQTEMYKIRQDVLSKNTRAAALADKYHSVWEKYIRYADTEYWKDIQSEAAMQLEEETGGAFDEDELIVSLWDYYNISNTETESLVEAANPKRWLRRIMAVDMNKYMEFVPSNGWIVQDSDQEILNKNYDEKYGSYVIPKMNAEYDNRAAYSKVSDSNTAIGQLYQETLKVIREANDLQSNRTFTDDFLLPQQTGSFWKRMKNQNGIRAKWNVFKQWIKEQIGMSVDQLDQQSIEYSEAADVTDEEGNVTEARKVSGEYPDHRKYHMLPQYWTRKLKDPSQLSSDLIGMLSDYYLMSQEYAHKLQVRDTLEMLSDAVRQQTYSTSTGNDTRETEQLSSSGQSEFSNSSTSNTARFIDKYLEMNLYDIARIRMNKKFGPFEFNFDKQLALVRRSATALNLGLNPKVAVVGFFTSQLVHMTNALCGQRYRTKSLWQSVLDVAHRILKYVFFAPKTVNNPLSTDKLMVTMETFNIADQQSQKVHHTNRNRIIQWIFRNSTFGFLGGLDYASKGNIVETTLREHHLVNGQFVTRYDIERHRYRLGEAEFKKQMKAYKNGKSLWSVIHTENEKFEIEDEYKEAWEKSRHKVISRLQKYPEDADGMATKLQRTLMMQSWLGVLVSLHRQYLPLMLDKYYGQRVYDLDTQEYKNGLHRNVFNFAMQLTGTNYLTGGAMFGGLGLLFLGSLLNPWIAGGVGTLFGMHLTHRQHVKNRRAGVNNKTIKQVFHDYFNDQSSEQKSIESLSNRYQLKQTLIEIALFMCVSQIADFVCGWADSDDDDTWWKYMLAYWARGTEWEMFTPYRTDDLLNNIKSATAATSGTEAVSNLLTGFGAGVVNRIFPRTLFNPSEILDLQQDLKDDFFSGQISNRSKSYAGMHPWQKLLIKTLPAHNIWEQFNDSKSKLGYLENQIMHSPRKKKTSLYNLTHDAYDDTKTSSASSVQSGL